MNEESVGKNIRQHPQTKKNHLAGPCPTKRPYEILFVENREVAKSPSLFNGEQDSDGSGGGGRIPSK